MAEKIQEDLVKKKEEGGRATAAGSRSLLFVNYTIVYLLTC